MTDTKPGAAARSYPPHSKDLMMICLALVAGMFAGITGWQHPDSETRAMCRLIGVAATLATVIYWSLQ